MRRLFIVAICTLGFGCGDNTEAPLDARADAEVPADARVDAPMTACTVAADCNDNDACTTDTCNAAKMCENAPKVIDDQIACTTDACNPTTGDVTHTPVNSVCEVDGKTCTVATCSATTGCSETPTASVCDDGATCSTDACAPTAAGADATTGCTNTIDNAVCADTFSCTTTTCAPDAVAGDPVTGCLVVNNDAACGDTIACTTETCNPAGTGADAAGCVRQTNDAMCEVDGKSCTVAACSATTGCSETAMNSLCNDNATCSADTCSATGPGVTGCVFTLNDAACSDTAECSSDACSPGVTGADATTGCLYTADAAVCSTNAMCSNVFDCVCNTGFTGDGLSCSGVACDALTSPANGTVTTTNGGLYPSTATYACNTGFAPIPSAPRTCNPDGTWSGAAPVCQPTFFVIRVGDGAAALGATAAAVFLEERDAAGTVLRTIPMPTAATGNNAPFVVQGGATAEGGLSRSANGRYVTLGGYAAAPGLAMVNSTSNRSSDTSPTNRVVARVAADGTVDTTTRMVDAFSGDSVRGVTSVDGSAFWAAGVSAGTPTTGGIQYTTFGSTGPTTSITTSNNNLRHPHVFGSQLYVSTGASTTRGVLAVGTGTPTTSGQPLTQVAPFPSTLSVNSFAVLDLDPVVVGVDTVYVAFDVTGVIGQVNVQKWTYNGTAWTQTAFAPTVTSTTTVLVRGLTTWLEGTAVHIVVTTNDSATSRILKIVDDGTTMTPAATVLATAAANTAFRGVALSPVP